MLSLSQQEQKGYDVPMSDTNHPVPNNMTRLSDWGGRLKWAAIALGVLLLLWLIFNFVDLQKRAELGAAYGAKMGCSCHFIQGRDMQGRDIQGRDMASCENDLEDAAGMVSMRIAEDKIVEASVPLLASARARYDGAAGCRLLAGED